MKIIFATKNNGKMKEVRSIMEGSGFEVISMSDAGIDIDVVEDGKTFISNAVKKSTEIWKKTGEIVLSDDSGLEIDFLDKAPGVYSARYLGENTPYDVKNKHILSLLDGVNNRSARFVCAIAAAIPKKDSDEPTILTALATFNGEIGYEISGENGFGYDPIFYVPEYGMTVAEMPRELKNKLSHRGKALREIKTVLEEFFKK